MLQVKRDTNPHDYKIVDLHFANPNNFQLKLTVVDRISETQLRVSEKVIDFSKSIKICFKIIINEISSIGVYFVIGICFVFYIFIST